MKIFNSPLVFRIPITIFQLSTSIIFFHTTTTFFQNSVCTKVQNKNPLVSIWIFQNGKKKATELIKRSLPNLFKRLAGKQKASPQNDVTFFKVNLNVTKNKTLFTYRFLFFTQLH